MGVGLLFAVLISLVYLFMARHFDRLTGVFAALSLLLMPRFFGHAHFCELDLPMAFMWFAGAAAFVQAVEGGWRRWVLAGLVFGCALLTKINALAMPGVFCVWGILYHRVKALPACLFLAIGIPMFFLGWPWMWFDTAKHLAGYLGSLNPEERTPILVYYLGRVYGAGQSAPVHYPLLMTLGTLPLGCVVSAIWGGVVRLRDLKKQPVTVFLVLNAGLILLSASMPGVPKYDGARLFLPAFPFIACLAGIGLREAFGLVERCLDSVRLASAVLGGYFLWLSASLVWIHPFYLSYYGGAVGGVSGANRVLQLESSYWAEAFEQEALDFLVRNAPDGGVYAIHPHERFALDLILKPEISAVRPDLREEHFDEDTWDLLILNCRQGMFSEKAWQLYRHGQPVFVHRRQGVPLCMIFQRE